jgi:SepF-like predicted cell division protein (DUF552 family)
MGLVRTLLGGSTGSEGKYKQLDETNLKGAESGSAGVLHKADIRGQQDIMAVKDALYDGDVVVADIRNCNANGLNEERVTSQLRQVVSETGGDMVKNGTEQLVMTPPSLAISRKKL